MIPEPVAITMLVAEALDELGVPYFVTGSLASAVHGVVRTTAGVDFVAQLEPQHADQLVDMLEAQFYADALAIRGAILQHGSFNMIHKETMFKVDIFVPRDRPYKNMQFERRTEETVASDPPQTACFATAEDTVLAKLERYRAGGEVCEQQWRDVLGVLRAQSDRLDRKYMREWAAKLGLEDLLIQATAEAEPSGGNHGRSGGDQAPQSDR